MGQFELQACSPAEAQGACESEVSPHLWMWVNPNLVCPIPGCVVAEGPLPRPWPPVGPAASPPSLPCPPEELLPTPSEAEKVSREEDSSPVDSLPLWSRGGTPGPPAPAPWKAKGLRSRSRHPKRAQGGWPRPPLNYCLLISLALSRSVDSSLTVQEIYQFTRYQPPGCGGRQRPGRTCGQRRDSGVLSVSSGGGEGLTCGSSCATIATPRTATQAPPGHRQDQSTGLSPFPAPSRRRSSPGSRGAPQGGNPCALPSCREHFPFFRTAPEGWKNTVRHNLCFSSSFEKTADFVHLEGSRKSRLWKLTAEGHRRFREEMQALSEDMMGLVHQSMDNPGLMGSLFGL
ncbi:forkhead box protein R1 isoform X2 [Hemicordylus capensis]|uniref:forkhead box protein R1 isoform X2 n=1 Tax=Hemicordylus capensis TaxID=884348 RepID=UPI002302DFA0|nr:forkhead box protein R1 isoform X2 [Hemicordylus capensis]